MVVVAVVHYFDPVVVVVEFVDDLNPVNASRDSSFYWGNFDIYVQTFYVLN